jgi:hypothetical protein
MGAALDQTRLNQVVDEVRHDGAVDAEAGWPGQAGSETGSRCERSRMGQISKERMS